MMLRFILIPLCFLFLTSGLNAQDQTPRLKTYYLVLLKKGPNRAQDSLAIEEIQRGHMAHLEKMAAEKKMCLGGPMGVSHEIRGICVYNTASLEETTQLVHQDPAIKSGRLIAEIIPWLSESGNCLP
jgi:uncharacterized protein YciI